MHLGLSTKWLFYVGNPKIFNVMNIIIHTLKIKSLYTLLVFPKLVFLLEDSFARGKRLIITKNMRKLFLYLHKLIMCKYINKEILWKFKISWKFIICKRNLVFQIFLWAKINLHIPENCSLAKIREESSWNIISMRGNTVPSIFNDIIMFQDCPKAFATAWERPGPLCKPLGASWRTKGRLKDP